MNRKIFCALLLLFFCFSTGCESTTASPETSRIVPSSWQIESYDENSSNVSVSGSTVTVFAKHPSNVELHYETKGTSQAFYVISVTVDLSQSKFSSDESPAIKLTGDTNSDYNGYVVARNLRFGDTPDKDECFSVQRVIKADTEGNLLFNIQIGTDTNQMLGTTYIQEVAVIPIESLEEYTVIKSDDETIRMVLYTKDIEESGISRDKLTEWLNIYAKLRKDLKWLIGGKEPYNGRSDFVLTETFPYYGLAGDPIYINEEFVVEDLSNIKISDDPKQSNIIWKYVHEMSHTFDGIGKSSISGNWNFDAEFFANLKMVYVLSANGYGMDADEFAGDKIINYFSAQNTLKNRVYSSNGFVYTLISTLDSDGFWKGIHETFVDICMSDVNLKADEEKFAVFWDTLNEKMKIEIKQNLSPNEWDAICAKFNYKQR